MKTTIKHDASNPKTGMTADEIIAFINLLPNSALDHIPKIRLTWRGTIKSVQVAFDHDEN